MLSVKDQARRRRHQRIRKKVSGTKECPRLCVTKSLRHLSVQFIDDEQGRTVLGLSTSSKELRGKVNGGNKRAAKTIGELIAQKAKALQITRVVFDRGGSLYHGRIHELAEAARQAGLKF